MLVNTYNYHHSSKSAPRAGRHHKPSKMFKNIIFVIATVLSLDSALAAYDESTNCTFFRPGVPACSGVTTSDVSDLIGYYLDSRENFALVKHPFNIYILVDVDYVWWPSTASNLFINGVFLYITQVRGVYYVNPKVGCCKPYILKRNYETVAGTRTLRNCDLYDAVDQMSKMDQYNTSCNVLQSRKLVGPYPAAQSFVSGGNVLIQTSSITTAVFVAANAENGYQLANEARRQALNIDIKIDGCNFVFTQRRNPMPPPCQRCGYDIFQEVPQGCDPDFCYLSTLTAQRFANPTSYTFGPLTYVKLVIFERSKRGFFYLEAYLTTCIFDDLLDKYLAGC